MTSCRLTPCGSVGDCVEELAVALTVCEVTAPSTGEAPTTRKAMKRVTVRRGHHLSAFISSRHRSDS
jgi:hypothetical protein